jgi:multidrug efflux pump subunit AcrB
VQFNASSVPVLQISLSSTLNEQLYDYGICRIRQELAPIQGITLPIPAGGQYRQSVVREGAIAAGLTALMILLFLGSWRSTVVVMISIPLTILSSLTVLYFLAIRSTR